MPSTLTFMVETEPVSKERASEPPYMPVHVIPLINGDPFIDDYKGNPFQALSVYGMDLKNGEMWAFNCECGTPECSRIEEPAKFTVDASTVQWQLPVESFDELAVDQGGTPKSPVIIFDRAQYETAFQELLIELSDLEQVHGRIKIHPIGHWSRTLDEEIAIERNLAEYRRILRAALGEFDSEKWAFVVRTQEGLVLSTSLDLFIHEATKPLWTDGILDLKRGKEALDRLSRTLRSDPSALLRQLDVHALSAHFRAVLTCESDEGDEPEDWLAPYWTDADSPREDIEFWAKVQQTGVVTLAKRDY